MPKPKRALSSYILMAGFLALLIVGGFFGYSIYAALTRSQITPRQQLGIAPIDGVITKEAIDNLELRRRFTPADFGRLVLNVISETPVASPAPVGTVSGGLR